MAKHNETGINGEQIAENFLLKKGYFILHRNWRHEKKEVDLIVTNKDILIFVEVKTRSSTGFGLPEDFVTYQKQQHMANAADAYIEIMNHEGEVRFDIISVLFNKKNNYTINHIEDAFWPV